MDNALKERLNGRIPLENEKTILHRNHGDYKITELMNCGGNALIYRAERISDNQEVVIKESYPREGYVRNGEGKIVPAYGQKTIDFFKNAEKEATRIKSLTGKEGGYNNYVDFLIDGFSENGTYYFVWQYGNYQPLPERADLLESLRIIARILEALAPIHKAEMLHLDISPGNILKTNIIADNNPVLKIIDFGSSHWLSEIKDSNNIENLEFTRSGDFTAPELRKTNPKNIDIEEIGFAADLYSVGKIFCYLIGLDRNPANDKIITRDDKCVKEINDDIIKLANKIIIKATKSDSDERYQNCQEMWDEIACLQKMNIPDALRKELEKVGSNIMNESHNQNVNKVDVHVTVNPPQHNGQKEPPKKSILKWIFGIVALLCVLALLTGVIIMLMDKAPDDSGNNNLSGESTNTTEITTASTSLQKEESPFIDTTEAPNLGAEIETVIDREYSVPKDEVTLVGSYTGEWKDDKPNGQGKIEYDENSLERKTYDGSWKDGLYNGKGKCEWSNGKLYEGEWKDGERNGQGTYTWADGKKYVGEFKDKRHGYGINTYANGDIYDGEWKDDKRNGQGTYTWADGEKYEGEWKDDKRHGEGIMTYSDGRVESGWWENDKLIENYNERGNTFGNIVNAGLAAQQGDWIYYRNDGDNGTLYKIRTDGSEKTKINYDYSYYINVLYDWIYYRNFSDGGSIYKISTTGTDRKKLNDDNSWYINVIGDWIYYQNDSDIGNIYKIRTDGTDKTKLNDEVSWHINVSGDWVYYQNGSTIDGDSDRLKLYKIRTDGTDRTKLNDEASGFINVVGDWIYYNNGNDDGNKLCKIRTDGTERTKLNDDNSWSINVVGEWVYYRNLKDNSKLYKIRTDGTERTKLNDDISANINVAGDWVYYQDKGDEGKLYRIRTDGTERQLVD